MIDHSSERRQRAGTFIVTGASSGIGFEIVRLLAAQGYDVVAVGRDASRLAQAAAGKESVDPATFDLARIDDIDAFAATLVAAHPDVIGLVNNAAIQHNVRMDDASYDAAAIAHEIAVNFTAPIVLTRGLLTQLQSRRRAVVVNISSGLGYAPKRTSAVYCATKAALNLFSEALRGQLAGSGVRVVDVLMPVVDTPMTKGRGSGKITARAAAQAVVDAIEANANGRVHVGKVKILALLMRLAPSIARRIMLRA